MQSLSMNHPDVKGDRKSWIKQLSNWEESKAPRGRLSRCGRLGSSWRDWPGQAPGLPQRTVQRLAGALDACDDLIDGNPPVFHEVQK